MSIKKNFLYNFFYRILILALPLITMPYIARTIGAAGVGVYAFTFAIVSYVGLFSMLGINKYGNRMIAELRDDKYKLSKSFWEIYFFQLINSMLMLTIFLIYLFVSEISHKNILIIQLIYVLSIFFDINWFFFGIEKFKITILRNAFVKIFSAIAIFAFVKEKADLDLYVYIMSASYLISNLVTIPFLKKEIVWIKPKFKNILSHFKGNIILFIPVISISLYKILDRIMISSMSSTIELGYFDYADKINFIQISLSAALGTVMLPRMSNLVSNKKINKIQEIIRNSMHFVMFLSIGMCFGLIGIANNFVPLFLGDDFQKTSLLLMILAPTGIIVSWANVIRTQYLLPNHHDKNYVISIIAGALINVTLNIFLIPIYGALGAVVATLMAETTIMLYQTYKAKNDLNINLYLKDMVPSIVSGIVMFIGIFIIKSIYIDNHLIIVLLSVTIGSIIYVSLSYFLTRILQKKRFLELKKIA
ncbi:flippase [Exiguobacterium sp. TDN 0502]|uniref:flippase n=1 Tax=Exiguobacterium sp. TDN 0502 TaxID=3420731 RepID=UPI003D7887A5